MSAAGFLKRVAQVLEDRGAAYGDPKTQMEAIAQRWSTTLGTPVTAHQVALCMIDLKLARLAYDPRHADSVVDVIGYAALLKEVRA
mgnify:CR=1 FL=1